ncbi:hypothetical protein BCR41DRAFT_344729 [Lobosporangium transversale]|uniref:Uncharacterized protein n=1 Tax=Lobosporangium transversale TaxID=64571 RepID=A0A1Y2H2E1_9FUNG|nr:hypothetical protein BCR41DRAFT_344729 [Lobosporangium transversale]ORZ28151.1 hypothetical protein BCR41DRAFT_344729 [Lobosporangium transversale]|eukprot:XP_021885836.1 hypothetical protein BCR41DRAFT_344729 [Lobosporangium transversale]
MACQRNNNNISHSYTSWKRALSSLFVFMSVALLSAIMLSPVSAQSSRGVDFFRSPTRSTTWYLGESVNIRLRRSLSKEDSNNTMIFLEYSTRACPGSSSPTAARWIANEDRYRYCDNRAAKITALGQIAPGSDSIQWTIPTTLDLQLSRGRFHLYDSNGHTSDSFLIRPRPRHYPRVGMVDQIRLF